LSIIKENLEAGWNQTRIVSTAGENCTTPAVLIRSDIAFKLDCINWRHWRWVKSN